MRASVPVAVLIGSLVAISVVLAGIASTLALARAHVERLDADLASLIRADYSADPEGRRLAPLDERIIDAVRRDEDRLQGGSSDAEIVPVFRVNPPDDSVAGDGPAATSTATSSFTSTPTPGTTPPASGETPPPGATPPASGETPPPGATPTPTPAPRPEPGSTPTPSPALKPSPTGNLAFYLHNDPSPPTGDTASQPVLPLDLTSPTADVLYNYDTDRDSFPGLLIQKGGSGPGETDPTRYQAWRSPVLATDLAIQGTLVVELWSAMQDFQQGKEGRATVYLRHFDGSSYTEIAQATRTDGDWQAGSSAWVLKTFKLSVVSFTLPAGHSLELKLVVGSSSGSGSNDGKWFAYDTAAYPSRVIITN